MVSYDFAPEHASPGERTDCPGSTNVLNSTLRIVNTTEATVIAPNPINAVHVTFWCPRGPRSIAMAFRRSEQCTGYEGGAGQGSVVEGVMGDRLLSCADETSGTR